MAANLDECCDNVSDPCGDKGHGVIDKQANYYGCGFENHWLMIWCKEFFLRASPLFSGLAVAENVSLQGLGGPLRAALIMPAGGRCEREGSAGKTESPAMVRQV